MVDRNRQRHLHLNKECLCHAESLIRDGCTGDRISRDESSNTGEEVTNRGVEDETIDTLVKSLTEQEGTDDKAYSQERQRGGGSLDDRELP